VFSGDAETCTGLYVNKRDRGGKINMVYITGNRKQKTFLPPAIEDYVGLEDPVRVYDAFVENIYLQEMGLPSNPFKAGALCFTQVTNTTVETQNLASLQY
jgi:hypothetical protein